MTAKVDNKHELKTKETRALLIRAAETIFARDGYEGAELGEIAGLAGRTKGAIYAQFRSKEDIFLALIEDRALCYRAKMEKHLARCGTFEESIAALRSFFLQRVDDHAWSLLLLEYKLFAMRHPESKKRLKERYDRIYSFDDEKRFAEILGPADKGADAISRVTAIQSLQPVISGLVLEGQLETTLSDKKVMKKVVLRIFDALLGVSAQTLGEDHAETSKSKNRGAAV